jgi:hypothetical protein
MPGLFFPVLQRPVWDSWCVLMYRTPPRSPPTLNGPLARRAPARRSVNSGTSTSPRARTRVGSLHLLRFALAGLATARRGFLTRAQGRCE